MSDQIPKHLRSTLRLVERAYPEGVPTSDYQALLFVLSEHLCEENLAIAASYWSQNDGSRLNDILAAKHKKPDTSSVVQKLEDAGFQEWIDEEEQK